jgi:signal transduction histidine kinase
MYSLGSAVIFGSYEPPQENGFRTVSLCLFGWLCCAKASWRFENDDKQKFQDARDLASKLEVSHLAEREKDARIAAERRTVESERLLTAFLCHEIRNPLNGVAGSLDMIQSELSETDLSVRAGDAELLQWCRSGVMSCKHLGSILDNVLDQNKLEEGKLALDALPVDLNELCTSVTGMLM